VDIMKRVKFLACILATFLSSSMITDENDAHARSAQEACETPIFKMWNKQQAKRLWSPSDETILAERSGKVYTYNCFTLEDIDKFFEVHQERIENAHFYPVVYTNDQQGNSSSDDGDC